MDEYLEQLHKDFTDILVVLDKFCKENDIEYSLAFGSLIGAIRHNGFIPWDDDLDIMMTRENFEKFRPLAIKYFSKENNGRFIYNDHNLDENYNLFFGKFYDTTKPFKSTKGLYHEKYLWIDVFPVDYVPGSKFKKFFLNYYIKYLSSGMASKGLKWHGKDAIKKLIFLPFSRKHIVKSFEKFWRKNLKNKDKKGMKRCCYTAFLRGSTKATYYPIDAFDGTIEHKFEDGEYSVYKNYDLILTEYYGDYMTPPPVKEQVRLH